jgi:hypothetical protein
MLSTIPARIAYSIFDSHGVTTQHFADLPTMLADLLMNSGVEIPYLVRDKLLPPAIEAWDRAKRQGECAHKVKDGLCTECGAEFGECA